LEEISIKFALKVINVIIGVRLHEKRVDCTEVYKRYFGPDYEIKYDGKYSTIISNHTGWIVRYLFYFLGHLHIFE